MGHALSYSNSLRRDVKRVEVEVTLRLTVNQSVCLGIEHPCGTCDQILLPVGMLLWKCKRIYTSTHGRVASLTAT
jgi:hypothetical protein